MPVITRSRHPVAALDGASPGRGSHVTPIGEWREHFCRTQCCRSQSFNPGSGQHCSARTQSGSCGDDVINQNHDGARCWEPPQSVGAPRIHLTSHGSEADLICAANSTQQSWIHGAHAAHFLHTACGALEYFEQGVATTQSSCTQPAGDWHETYGAQVSAAHVEARDCCEQNFS